VPEIVLVRIAWTRRQLGPGPLLVDQLASRSWELVFEHPRDPDRRHDDTSSAIRARMQIEPALGRMQGDGQVRPGDMDRIDMAGVRIDAAGDVHRDHFRPAIARRIDGADRFRLRALGRAREAASEHRVDKHYPRPAPKRLLRVLASGGPPRPGRERCVALQRFGRTGEPDVDLQRALAQQAGGDGAVTPVVPRPAEHDDLARLKLLDGASNGGPSALHQHPGGKLRFRGREPIQLALLGRGEQPHPIRSFMSRTARSMPVSTARQTMA
jgi:hypothetical protein